MLLFVAAHWDSLAPSGRFALLLVTVAAFHLGGTAAPSPGLSATLHACGTAALGGGIFLAGQIFHLSEHWPGGLLLWALGAWAGWALLRDWPQALLAALLTPAWLAGEWTLAARTRSGATVLTVGLLLTALAYLAALPTPPGGRIAPRRALAWSGGIALIPLGVALVASGHGCAVPATRSPPPFVRSDGWSPSELHSRSPGSSAAAFPAVARAGWMDGRWIDAREPRREPSLPLGRGLQPRTRDLGCG